MPIQDGQYVAPTFVNDAAPALNASEMNALAGAAAGAVEYDRTMALTSAQKQKARENIQAVSANAITVQALYANWAGASAPFTNTINVTGVTATNNIVVGLSPNTSAAQYEAFSDGEIICTAQGAGTITMTAYGTKPTVDINISVLILG